MLPLTEGRGSQWLLRVPLHVHLSLGKGHKATLPMWGLQQGIQLWLNPAPELTGTSKLAGTSKYLPLDTMAGSKTVIEPYPPSPPTKDCCTTCCQPQQWDGQDWHPQTPRGLALLAQGPATT